MGSEYIGCNLCEFHSKNVNKNIFFAILIIFIFFISCHNENTKELEIKKIPIPIDVERFEVLFSNLSTDKLGNLKQSFPFLFPQKYHDSIWIQKSKDSLQKEVVAEIHKVFHDFSDQKEQIHSLLQHVKYYFPQTTIPRVITINSDVDYHHKIVLTESLLLIALDTYLGKSHRFYEGIPVYIKKNLEKEQLLPDIASKYAKQFIQLPSNSSFLANMIYYGKELYLKNLFLPKLSDSNILGHTSEQLTWLQANESQIWRYFISKEMLFSTDRKLPSRFLHPAPFSKFYLEEIDKEAPDRVGQYIGWRIITSFMDNNEVSLNKLLTMDAEAIFKKSKYKPN